MCFPRRVIPSSVKEKSGPAGNVKVSAEVVLSEKIQAPRYPTQSMPQNIWKTRPTRWPIIKKTEKLSENFFENLQKILDGTCKRIIQRSEMFSILSPP